MKNIDCANCSAKIEAKIRELPEVEDAVLTFATPWEPPVEAARRIRRQVGSVLCGWFVPFEEMAAGIGPILPALCREGFDRFRAAPDANSARLNFESYDGF